MTVKVWNEFNNLCFTQNQSSLITSYVTDLQPIFFYFIFKFNSSFFVNIYHFCLFLRKKFCHNKILIPRQKGKKSENYRLLITEKKNFFSVYQNCKTKNFAKRKVSNKKFRKIHYFATIEYKTNPRSYCAKNLRRNIFVKRKIFAKKNFSKKTFVKKC